MTTSTRKKPKKQLTRGERMCGFIERHCVVPEGDLIGQRVVLDHFQRKFILDVYDNPHVTDTAILSIARKNAKTGTIAFIALGHIVGPEAIQNSRLISGAMSKEQAAEVYNYASKCVMLSETLRDMVKIIPSTKKLVGLLLNVEYQAISADAKTSHGKSPIVAILDEVGQVRGPTSDFVDAITTSQGAYSNPLMIYISTQAPNDNDLLSLLIDDALKNKHPKTVCHLYAADPDCDLMDEEQWKKANPALGKFRSYSDMKKQADKAERMPTFRPTFRNLNLNQRVATNNPFIDRDSWKACGKPLVPIEQCVEFYGGLDLSSRKDLTAFVLFGWDPESQTNQAYSYFWTPGDSLAERAKADAAPYELWVEQGYLRTTPRKVVDFEYVLQDIEEIVSGLDLKAIAFDRWRIDDFKKEMERLNIELPLENWGQGFKDMAPALDALEEQILNRTMAHGNHPVLTMCAANGVVTKDPAGNRKIDKHKTSARIDGLVALAMAAGIAAKYSDDEEDISEFISNPVVVA